ncbi:MAG: calcium/sodium antiporter [Deltaproteobacteria bacterium]|nr:calcium/sodium antiporter [Deltaproteobacteria bacterium]
MLVDALFLVFGIALLYFGGEALVDGASKLARRLGMSTLVIGLTIVAFGTSAPELAATMTATLSGAPELGLGNVVGSNIANIGLILGVSALLLPLATTTRFILRELPFMIGCSALMVPLVYDDLIGRGEGIAMCALLLAYLGFMYQTGREAPDDDDDDDAGSLGKSLLWVVGGSLLLVGGAQALVYGGVGIARDIGVSERVIGLTMVAVGTSLPELASSLAAARKGESDMVLGNVVGSNIFNVLCILGVTSSVRPMVVNGAEAQIDLWAMLALTVAVPLLLWKGRRMGRAEGIGLLVFWGIWVGSLVLRLPATG